MEGGGVSDAVDASLKRKNGLNSRHRKIFGYITKEYSMH